MDFDVMSIVGKVFDSNNFGQFKVIRYVSMDRHRKNRLYEVEFLDTGYKIIKPKSSIMLGNVKDKYLPIVCGVGYLGDATIVGYQKEYDIWSDMLRRCYSENSPNYNRYGGKGVYVDEKWHCFANFLRDVQQLENYNLWKKHDIEYNLDKDILQSEVQCKVYSKDTCKFVTREENLQNRKLKNTQGYKFIAIMPSGEEIKYTGVKPFAEEYQLSADKITKCLKGIIDNYKGWRFRCITTAGGVN